MALGAGGCIAQRSSHINVLLLLKNGQINYVDINLIANKSRRQPAYSLFAKRQQYVCHSKEIHESPVRTGKQKEVTSQLNGSLLRTPQGQSVTILT